MTPQRLLSKEEEKLLITPCHKIEKNHCHISREGFIYMTSQAESIFGVYLEILSPDNPIV